VPSGRSPSLAKPPAMSSLRNAVKRKTHKERSQPAARAKFGLLEKHKDYVLRARDFNNKKKRLQALKEKASFRNPDEFYFKMEKMRTKEGVHVNTSSDSIDADTLKLLKTQDLNYVHMKKKVDDTKIQKLHSNLHCISALADAPKQNSHTIFLDSDEDPEDFDAAEHFDTVPELVDRAHNRQRRSKLEEGLAEPKGKASRKMEREKEAQYRELLQRMERKKKLDTAMHELQTQRNLLGKGRRRKAKGEDGSTQFVWRQERKR